MKYLITGLIIIILYLIMIVFLYNADIQWNSEKITIIIIISAIAIITAGGLIISGTPVYTYTVVYFHEQADQYIKEEHCSLKEAKKRMEEIKKSGVVASYNNEQLIFIKKEKFQYRYVVNDRGEIKLSLIEEKMYTRQEVKNILILGKTYCNAICHPTNQDLMEWFDKNYPQ